MKFVTIQRKPAIFHQEQCFSIFFYRQSGFLVIIAFTIDNNIYKRNAMFYWNEIDKVIFVYFMLFLHWIDEDGYI